MSKQDVLQPVDDTARRAARTFLREARFGALATLDPATGAPLASRVSLASDSRGCPVFLISQLSAHFGALEADPRASVLLGEPGRGDPLAHPRITVTGRATRVAGGARTGIRARFLARHPKAGLYADFGDFAFWRLEVERASYNGGFGKAFEMAAADLLAPADPELEQLEPEAVAHLNADHGDALALYAQHLARRKGDDWALACIDIEGLDLIRGEETARVWFDPPLTSAAELRPRLVALAKRARQETP